MSTHLPSQKHSSPWFEILVIILGAGLVIFFAALGLGGILALGQALPVTGDKAYWFISRSSGVLAYLLLTLGVMWGLVQSGSILRPTLPPLLALGLHSFLNWASLAMSALHGLILLGDNFIKMRLADIVLPFIGPYKPMLVGLGVVGFYLMFLLSLSFYLRRHIGQHNFRLLHYASYLTYLLVTWHSLAIGTDSQVLWPLYALSLAAVALLTIWRILNSGQPAPLARSR